MAINVGNQNAGQINNVEGTQNLSGQNLYAPVVATADAQAAAQLLHATLQQLNLPAGVGELLRRDAEAVQRDLAAGEPNRAETARRLERITNELGRLGALAETGAKLVGPLQTLGRWLGPVGATLLSHLT
ncbi:hypothetical protein [Paractinoplanes lichenicola]|uniref:Uncharacterized protein n=1 Tax=Paractinoplanes lichenicola TaxID=2802976 RepID=A0ABS1VS93_9ACTN|nr:hypothetical protein [Actinoplanes lichenicola]MBL7257503.1 hypothetical protein [Actinoplanes lichenicola]